MAKTETKETLKEDYRKGALGLNKIAAKLNMEYNEEPPEVPKYKPFKGTTAQLDKIKELLGRFGTVNNTGFTTILGVCGITNAGPVLDAREALQAAEVIEVKEIAGKGKNTGKLICLFGEKMADVATIIEAADVFS